MKVKLLFLLFAVLFILVQCDLPTDQGAVLYKGYCANCHMENGEGLRGLIPPLAGADYLKTHHDELACIIRKGMEGEIIVNGKSYNQPMIGFENLNEIEVSNIVNYISSAWKNDLPAKNIKEIQSDLKRCE